ncbi:MAG: ATP-binding cassette domain-containing protein [Planctomycetota bacterium]|nr:MAG: ATP-binding cassette domain-containing protein [Planctomycetota bacterium]
MIQVENLCKEFYEKKRGKVQAVDYLSFEVKKGEVFGLLGPNGAGKTTTLRIIATLLTPTGGKVKVGDYDVLENPLEVRKILGFLSADMGLYHRLTPRETIAFFGRMYGMDKETIQRQTEMLAEELEMKDFLDAKIDTLSTGMKQKTAIARTLVGNPEVLILDEPTSGLDILSSRVVENFILKAKDEGKTIILSTHIMEEAEYLCDSIGVIHKGRLQARGTISELKNKTGRERLREVFLSLLGVKI